MASSSLRDDVTATDIEKSTQFDISVVVRFSRRDLVLRALDSLTKQHSNLGRPRLELVLVDVLGSGQKPIIPDSIKDTQWVSRGIGLDRPAALAAGINSAQGEYCIILDDDDWFDPPHLQKLFFALQAARSRSQFVIAATTGVRLIDEEGRIYRVWDTPLRRERMLLVNWLPPQAVLFHTLTAQRQCVVDPTLSIYEDWDLWMQLMTQGDFVHVPGISANYLYNSAGSGVHDPANQARHAENLRRKWLGFFSPELINRIRADLEQADDPRALKKIDALENELAKTKQQLFEMRSSRAWRITEPIRMAGTVLRSVRRILNAGLTLFNEARILARSPKDFIRHIARSVKQHRELLRLRQPGRTAIAAYSEWRARHHRILFPINSGGPLTAGFKKGQELFEESPPMISVVMPIYKPQLAWLDAAIDSLITQTYPRWELCMVDDGSGDQKLSEHLKSWADRDSRIRVEALASNQGISSASNRAVGMAHAEWIALMDQDDLLDSNAFFWVVQEIKSHPNLVAIYSDEDKINAEGLFSEPYFKPEFDPILILQQNFFSHLGVFRKESILKIGGFRSAFNGSQDHDLILRLSRSFAHSQIRHIPRVLYHWRIHAHSTSGDIGNKDFAHTAGLRAVQDHLDIAYPGFRVRQRNESQFFQVIPAQLNPDEIRQNPVTVEIIIPTRDRLDLLKKCIRSLKKTRSLAKIQITIVDNGSSQEDSLAYLNELAVRSTARIIRDDGDFNYSRLNNAAIAQSKADYIVLMNNDVEVIDGGWLDIMLGWAMRPEIGAVGAKLLYANRTVQHAGVILGLNGVAGHAFAGLPGEEQGYFGHAILNRSASAVTAATLLVSREKFNAAGGLDEQHLAVAFNDVDLCLRLKALGYHNMVVSDAVLLHHESASRGSDLIGKRREGFIREIEVMQQRWGSQLLSDPYYNPNLSLRFGHALAEPPRL